MDEEESYAHFYLRKQGVERLDVLTFISHGLDEGPGSRGVEAGAESGENGEAKADPLAQYTVELTARAREGKIDPLVGRVTELDRAVEVLCRRRKNNPLFVGDPGVGKTALAEGLALRIVEGNVPDMDKLITRLVEVHYERNDYDFHRGTFRVRGDALEIIPAYHHEHRHQRAAQYSAPTHQSPWRRLRY